MLFDVNIHINNEDELYNSFDSSGTTLSEDFTSYLIAKLEDRKPGEKLCINVSCPDTVNEKKLITAISAYLSSAGKSINKQRKGNAANSIRLLVIGIAFVVLGLVFSGKIGEVTAAIISTIGSFSIWEAANVWLQELPKIRMQARMIKFLEAYELSITKS